MPGVAFPGSSLPVAEFKLADRHPPPRHKIPQEPRGAGPDAFRLVFSDYVFDETVTALVARAKRHELASAAGHAMLESKNLRLVRVDSPAFAAAWKLFVRRSDKRWSFTDCTSFVLMENLGIRKALTFDANFRQAGFATFP